MNLCFCFWYSFYLNLLFFQIDNVIFFRLRCVIIIYSNNQCREGVALFDRRINFSFLMFGVIFALYSLSYAADYRCGYEPSGCDQNSDCSAVVQECTGPYNGQYLCGINQTACQLSVNSVSYKQESSVKLDWETYGIVLSDDGKSLAPIGTTNYVALNSNGIGYKSSFGISIPIFEISNGQIRVSCLTSDSPNWGNWISISGSGVSKVKRCNVGNNSYVGIETSDGKIRFCMTNLSGNWECGNWITLPSSNSCPSGYSYNSKTGKCEQITYTCPLGSSYPCVNTGSGVYCSPYQCVDISNQGNIQNDDTTPGANDKQDNGPKDSLGRCQGIIRIFNGNDRRCRTAGIETGWLLDCCKKDKFLILKCKKEEQDLYKLKTTIQYRGQEKDYSMADANCHYVGSYCSKKIKYIGCVQKRKTYCCFHSALARIIQEQGRPQIGKGWGDPKSPDCSGFTINEFQKLDFSKIDFSEWVNMIVGQETANLQNNLQNRTNDMRENIQNMYK
jgi:hypothetical protein